jgi:hypothetical protein
LLRRLIVGRLLIGLGCIVIGHGVLLFSLGRLTIPLTTSTRDRGWDCLGLLGLHFVHWP